jgi:molybdate transport system substrate-binding protein
MLSCVVGRRLAAGALGALLGLAVACGSGDAGGGGRLRLTVLAAASIAPALDAVAARWEATRPDVDVVVSGAGSSALVGQVLDGLPADVVVTADTTSMDRLAGVLAGPPRVVALNEVVLAVPSGSSAAVTGLASLGDPAVRSGLCAPQVPCGRYAREWLDAAGIIPVPVTEEPDVRSLVAKLRAGELDAAVVYATDVRASGGALRRVDHRGPPSPVARYPAAVTDAAATSEPRSAAAEAFVAAIAGPGREQLVDAGFGVP